MANRIMIIGRSGTGKVTITPAGSQTVEGKATLTLARAGEVVALIEEGSYTDYPSIPTLSTIAPGDAGWDAFANANDQTLAAYVNQYFSRAVRRTSSASDALDETDEFVLFTGSSAQVATLPDIGGSSNWRVLGHYGRDLPLASDVTTDSPVGTSEETVKSATIPGGWTDVDGKGFAVRAIVATASNGNNKTARLTYGAFELITTGAIALNNGRIVLEATVRRTGATAQIAEGQARCTDSGVLAPKTQAGTPAETLASDQTVALLITCPTANTDATVELFEIRPLEAF